MGKISSSKKLNPNEFQYLGQTHKLPTIIPNMPNRDYHSKDFRDFISHSGLVKLGISPAHFKAFTEESESTPAMEFGTPAHIIMLEDDQTKVVVGDYSYWSPQAKAWKEQTLAGGAEAVVLKKEYDVLLRMKKTLSKHKWAKLAISNGLNEHSCFFIDKMYEGVRGRIRPDCWRKDIKLIGDYKTARSAQPREFASAVIQYGYDIQAHWYVRAMKQITGDDYDFMFIVQEKEPPYAVNCFMSSDLLLRCGEIRTNRALTTYWNCIENPELFNLAYEYYEDKLLELDPPAWAIKQYGVTTTEPGNVEDIEIEDLIQPLEKE